MRGSLLAGKPYPTAVQPGASAPETAADERLDRVLFSLHQIEGQLQDLRMSLDELRDGAPKRLRKKKSRKRKDKVCSGRSQSQSSIQSASVNSQPC
jgi:hypothetical protein